MGSLNSFISSSINPVSANAHAMDRLVIHQTRKFFHELLTVCVTAKVFYSKTFALYGMYISAKVSRLIRIDNRAGLYSIEIIKLELHMRGIVALLLHFPQYSVDTDKKGLGWIWRGEGWLWGKGALDHAMELKCIYLQLTDWGNWLYKQIDVHYTDMHSASHSEIYYRILDCPRLCIWLLLMLVSVSWAWK